MYCNLQNNFDNYEMISASKRKSVLKLTINQYNTVKSLNCKRIALGQRILPNLHSFQLEKQICLEIRRSVTIRIKSPTLAQVATNLAHHRKVLVYAVQSWVLKWSRKFPNVGKIHLECSVKRISGQDQIFRFKLPFEQQSFISGVGEYVQIMRMAI
ncbi:Hypothetical_protein [Hexamita inflata]|uniref:Hypothetical_protein n=1 Tax=Hexamita inflata TaxID=28002 RepID=A0AA86TW81_9EUKA|nr:Hypothetical protein HINF_LOCUS11508 [Hexamita inflata]